MQVTSGVPADRLPTACWRKSRASNPNGACVEVGKAADSVAVRDTKRRDGAELRFDAPAWRKFVASIKR